MNKTYPGKYNYKDKIKFKRCGKIVEGIIVGTQVSCIDTANEYVEYIVHAAEGIKPYFSFYHVPEYKIID